jgi:hypothetical protein
LGNSTIALGIRYIRQGEKNPSRTGGIIHGLSILLFINRRFPAGFPDLFGEFGRLGRFRPFGRLEQLQSFEAFDGFEAFDAFEGFQAGQGADGDRPSTMVVIERDDKTATMLIHCSLK